MAFLKALLGIIKDVMVCNCAICIHDFISHKVSTKLMALGTKETTVFYHDLGTKVPMVNRLCFINKP